MSIERDIERIATALEQIALGLEGELSQALAGAEDSPQGEQPELPLVEVEEVEVVEETAEVIDLSAAPVVPAQPDINGTESIPPAAGVTKATLWEELKATYNHLHPLGRGQEIGDLLGQYSAVHIDQLDPAHYMTVYQALVAMRSAP